MVGERTYTVSTVACCHFNMKLFFICLFVFVTIVNTAPQVPYDYIPLGRRSNDEEPKPMAPAHPSDIVMTYEKLHPIRKNFNVDPSLLDK